MQALQAYLQQHKSPGFELPPLMASPPRIYWSGPITAGPTPPTLLPGGVRIAASSTLIGTAVRDRYAGTLSGTPTIEGYPCLQVDRPYECRGVPRKAAAKPPIRIKTNAPLIELTGVVPEGSPAVQTLIVNGELAPPKTLSTSLGLSGGNLRCTIVIEFDTRDMRDILIDTAMYLAYVTVDAQDALLPLDDANDPQFSIVGDSYLQCTSTTFCNYAGIAHEIGARLGVRKIVTDTIGGTGYQNTGGDLGNLNDRLPAHAPDNSIVYLVMAGLNDYGDVTLIPPPQHVQYSSREGYEACVFDYLKNLRSAQPKALIAVTAPYCPIPPESDSIHKGNAATNTSNMGDYLYKADVHLRAIQQIAGPWVYIDVLMGGGWLNSSGARGDVTHLQWFTGGTAGPGTTATYRPGNTAGGGGGGYGGIKEIPIVSGGTYSQAPEITATGGSGRALQLASLLDSAGKIRLIRVVDPGYDYSAGAGLPTLHIDPTYEITPAVLGTPELLVGTNPNGQYPLPEFAPAGATDLNNIYRFLKFDLTHPSSLGVEHLSKRLAENLYQAVMAL